MLSASTCAADRFGGLVAQAWLRERPEVIGDIVLSGTGVPDPARADKNARLMPWMQRVPMAVWRGVLRLAVHLSTNTRDRTWRVAGDYTGAAVGAMHWANLESRYRIAIDVDAGGPPTLAALPQWRGRLLVLAGSKDPMARPAVREAMSAAYPGATFRMFSAAGHAPTLDDPTSGSSRRLGLPSLDVTPTGRCRSSRRPRPGRSSAPPARRARSGSRWWVARCPAP